MLGMLGMRRCLSCDGFLPAGRERCPNCAAPERSSRSLATRLGLVAGPLGGSAIAITLMACYGAPPCDDGTYSCLPPPNHDAGGDADAARDTGLADASAGDGGHDAAPGAPDGSDADSGQDAAEAAAEASTDASNDAASEASTDASADAPEGG